MTSRTKARSKKNAKGALRTTPRMLRLREVETLCGLKRSAIYAAVARGQFPKPRKLTATATAWREDEVRAWIESRPLAAGSSGSRERGAAPPASLAAP